jgi:hypothetical protein
VRSLAAECGVVCTPMSVFYADQDQSESCTLVRGLDLRAAVCETVSVLFTPWLWMQVRFTICKSREHIQRACAALAGRRGRRERVAGT